MTPIRVITAAMPSYTRYLNPYGSLVSRRRDLVKATQPIPGFRVVSPVRRDPFASVAQLVARISSATPFPWFIRLNYIVTLRLPAFSSAARSLATVFPSARYARVCNLRRRGIPFDGID